MTTTRSASAVPTSCTRTGSAPTPRQNRSTPRATSTPRPDATADAFRDGWFLTGDIGEFDADGYLSIVGRSKDLIITGGFNVYPREIEEVLAEHPAVAEAAVAGEPSDEWGETVVAYVVTSSAVSEADLIEWCAARLAKYKRPRHVRFLDALPRNALGKVVKTELRIRP